MWFLVLNFCQLAIKHALFYCTHTANERILLGSVTIVGLMAAVAIIVSAVSLNRPMAPSANIYTGNLKPPEVQVSLIVEYCWPIMLFSSIKGQVEISFGKIITTK